MKPATRRWFGAALVLALAVPLVVWLREETLTRHEPVDTDKQIEVTISGERRDVTEPSPLVFAQALASRCETEVRSTLTSLDELAPNRFRLVFEPTLDEADRRQLGGCLEDMTVDHFLARVESMVETDRG